MGKPLHRKLSLDGPAGRLEALLWTAPEDIARSSGMVAVVAHPHPLHGGTLHNKVVYQAAKTMHGLGLPVLRFNFRGAGMSEGVHDDGRGEQEDVLAAIRFMTEEFPDRMILVAGFSFGAAVGLRAGCSAEDVAELIGIGLPSNHWDLAFLKKCSKPKLILQGGSDQYGSRESVQALFEEMPEPKRLTLIQGADHFFAGKLEEMKAAIRDWLVEGHPEMGRLEGWREKGTEEMERNQE